MRSRLFLLSIILLIGVSCQHKKATTEKETVAAGNTYTNPLLERGAEPWAIFHEGKYYYTQGSQSACRKRSRAKHGDGPEICPEIQYDIRK